MSLYSACVCGIPDGSDEPHLRTDCPLYGHKALLTALREPLGADGETVAGRTVRHRKRGTIYTVIGDAKVQGAIFDEEPAIVYRGEDGQFWVRSEEEFNDGRFEDIIAGQPAALSAARPQQTNGDEGRALLKAAIGLRDDLLERAEWDGDCKVVCVGSGAWRRFCDAIRALSPDQTTGTGDE